MPRVSSLSHFLALHREVIRLITFVLALALWGSAVLLLPPRSFVGGVVLRIPEGVTARAVAKTLAENGAVVHEALFIVSLFLVGGNDATVQSGAYLLHDPLGPAVLAWRLTRGVHGVAPVRVTIPEGLASYEIADILSGTLLNFSREQFLTLAEKKEGFLFPDTYDFSPFAAPQEVMRIMRSNFDKKTEPLREKYHLDETMLSRVVIIASLLEREARTSEDRRLIAGIIENRLRAGMPLQIDAVFGYIFRRPPFHPSGEEVLEVDSPYNTYRYAGLPPGPIGNPGLSALEDALNPTPSDYLYYLTDRNGTMHYSRTFTEHVAKKLRYLQPQ